MRCVGDVLAAVAADDARTARAGGGARRGRVRARCRRCLDPEAALAPGAPQVEPEAREPALALGHPARRRGRGARGERRTSSSGTWQTQRIEHLFLEPEAALAEPLPDGRLAPLHAGPGHLRRPPAGRRASSACPRSERPRRAGAERRRVRRQGGHVGPGADRAARPASPAGRCKLVADARGVDPPAPQAPSDHDATTPSGCDAEGRLTAVAARMIGDSGAYASVGGKVLERAAGHAVRPVPGARRRRRVARRLHEQPAVRRHARLRREPGGTSPSRAAWTCSRRRPASTAGRSAGATRSSVGDTFTTGQVLEKSVGLQKTLLAVKDAYYEARRAGRAVGHRLRHQEQRHRQRRRRVGQGAARRRGGRHGLALQRLHRDGPGAAHRPDAVRGRGHRAAGRPSSARRSTPRFALGCGQTTGSRATLFGGRAVIERGRGS